MNNAEMLKQDCIFNVLCSWTTRIHLRRNRWMKNGVTLSIQEAAIIILIEDRRDHKKLQKRFYDMRNRKRLQKLEEAMPNKAQSSWWQRLINKVQKSA